MPEFIYQIAISLFAGLIRIVAPFNQKIKRGVLGRKGLLRRLQNDLRKLVGDKPVAWFHAASLGEFEQGRPVIEAYRNRYPGHFILLTFFSPSGYEIRKDYKGADYICYLPIDTASNARQFVEIVRPEIAFFIKYEFWFNYLRELKLHGVKVISFSAIFRENQSFFKPYGGFFRKMLRFCDHIFVQDQNSVRLLNQIGISAASVAGDTRFDRVSAIALQARELPEISVFKGEKLCLVAGSVWEADMQVLIPALNQISSKVKVIIAPHEINKPQIEGWRGELTGRSLLYSDIGNTDSVSDFDYLFIDNIGMLSSLYRYGDMAFIGGSFGAGLHNILEAATFGLPIIFGNKGFHKFREATELIEKQGAFAVADSGSIVQLLEKWIEDPEIRLEAGKVSREYVAGGTGATQLIMQKVGDLLG